jgi:hypothetical protein
MMKNKEQAKSFRLTVADKALKEKRREKGNLMIPFI